MRPVLVIVFLAAIAAASAPSGALERSKSAAQARERINKLNKAWDERLARMLRAKIEADCKAEAKKTYAAIRFNKRRAFVEECISRATAPTAAAMPDRHQVY